MNTRQHKAALAAITAIDTDTPVDFSLIWICFFDKEGTSGNTVNYQINRKHEAEEYMNDFDWPAEPDPELLVGEQRARFYRWEAVHAKATRFLDDTWLRLRKATAA